MARVLLVAATTGYQLRSFSAAAERVGAELVLATDRCHVLDDPWRDQAVPVRFHDELGSVRAIVQAMDLDPPDAVLAVGDRPALIGALAAEALQVTTSSSEAVRTAGNKLRTRRCLQDANLPCPWFTTVPNDEDVVTVAERISFPCVVKPLALSASRGVMRADTVEQLDEALTRVRHLLRLPDVQALGDHMTLAVLVEGYVSGPEFAVEGVLTDGSLQTLAVFDKPDPLDGPFFEETIYVTAGGKAEASLEQAVARAATAIGLTHGPIHAECRRTGSDVYVIEIAPRPIGGLCSRALRFTSPTGQTVSLEDLLLRHALGDAVTGYRREGIAAGVMLIPIPTAGRYREVKGLEWARRVVGVEDVVITAKRDQQLVPLPEGGSYLGFIFARAENPSEVERALREAHGSLAFDIAPVIPMAPPLADA